MTEMRLILSKTSRDLVPPAQTTAIAHHGSKFHPNTIAPTLWVRLHLHRKMLSYPSIQKTTLKSGIHINSYGLISREIGCSTQ